MDNLFFDLPLALNATTIGNKFHYKIDDRPTYSNMYKDPNICTIGRAIAF
ncbi:MAG TPA: hypothetical protein V6D25_03230 [Leptolyngbyaceae cyanobacterium]